MAAPSQSAIQNTQNQVNQVVDVMKDNLNKVLERDNKLSELQDRSDAMQMGANQFQLQSTQLKRKMWWQNFKMWIILGIIFIIFILVISAGSTTIKEEGQPLEAKNSARPSSNLSGP